MNYWPYLVLLYFAGWVIPAIMMSIIDTTEFSKHYWAYIWGLPISTGKYHLIIWWMYLWKYSGTYQVTGYIATMATMIALLGSYFKKK